MADPESLVRLRRRGDLSIDNSDDGWHVSWWPKGQRGNPFCGRGWSGDDLVTLLSQAETETRPEWRSIEMARWYRQQDAMYKERERERQRERSRIERERKEAEYARWEAELQQQAKKREQERVQPVLEGNS